MIGEKSSQLETTILTLRYDYYKTALDEKTLFEDEMNNVGTARKRTATSATTKKKRKVPKTEKS